MLGRLRRFLCLPPADRRLFLRAFLALAAIDVRLRLHGFRRVVEGNRAIADARLLTAPSPAGRGGSEEVDADQRARAVRYAHWLEVAARHHPMPARCLHRSLVLHHWLRQQGLPGELRIGVSKGGGALKAHAWVELDGQPLSDGPAQLAGFTPLTHPDGRPATWARGVADGSESRRPILLDVGGLQWQ